MIRGLAAAAALALLSGCFGSRNAERPPDDTFGHRYEDVGPDGRTVVSLVADDDRQFFYYPTYIDSVHIRPGSAEPRITPDMQRVAVEVLVKGVFPDDCVDLARLEQHRYGHIVEAELLMRKPQDVTCRRVRRPFRFYFTLDGSYRPGAYTLKLNGSTYPFTIRPDPL